MSSCFGQICGPMPEFFLDRVRLPSLSLCVVWDEYLFDKLVQLVQVQIR